MTVVPFLCRDDCSGHDGGMMSSTHNRVNEVDGAHTAGDARQRLREHRYADALVLVRETLTKYLAHSDPRTGWIPTRFILGSQYGRLAAAFDDASTLDLMDKVVERMAAADADVDYERRRAELAGYHTDLEAMNALRSAVITAEGGVFGQRAELRGVSREEPSRVVGEGRNRSRHRGHCLRGASSSTRCGSRASWSRSGTAQLLLQSGRPRKRCAA